MADTWEALKQDCMACRGCALADTRTNVVFGDGAEAAEIRPIGEGPGQHEDGLLYPSDAADDLPVVDLGVGCLIKKKKQKYNTKQ